MTVDVVWLWVVAKCDRYWDLPFNNYNYSYIDHALSHG